MFWRHRQPFVPDHLFRNAVHQRTLGDKNRISVIYVFSPFMAKFRQVGRFTWSPLWKIVDLKFSVTKATLFAVICATLEFFLSWMFITAHLYKIYYLWIIYARQNSICVCVNVKVLVAQSCLTLCDPMDCSLLGSSVQGILQARILEPVAIGFSRGSSQPKDRTCVSYISCIGRQVLYHYSS